MSILSVPLTGQLSELIDHLVKTGVAANKADLARKAIEYFAEDQAVRAVLDAEQEVREGKVLHGDLDILAKQI